MEIINSTYPITGFLESKKGGRDENQDFLGFADTHLGFLLVLCDGMGGGPGGCTASQTTVKTVIEYVKSKDSSTSPKEALAEAIAVADVNIAKITTANPALTGMGTTIVCFLFNKQSAWVAHVGDSRFYQFRFGRKVYRTIDHSFVSELVQKGALTEEQARLSTQSNIITRALNGRGIAKPDIKELAYEKGDRFMLCSDGIWGAKPEPQLIKDIAQTKSVSGAVVQITYDVEEIGKAEGGKYDNLSIAVIETQINSKKKVPMSKRTIKNFLVVVALLVASLVANVFLLQRVNRGGSSDENGLTALRDSISKLNAKNAELKGRLQGKDELANELRAGKSKAEDESKKAQAELNEQKQRDNEQKEEPQPENEKKNLGQTNQMATIIQTLNDWIKKVEKGNPINEDSIEQLRTQIENANKLTKEVGKKLDEAIRAFTSRTNNKCEIQKDKLKDVLDLLKK